LEKNCEFLHAVDTYGKRNATISLMKMTIQRKLRISFLLILTLLVSSFLFSYLLGRRQRSIDTRIMEQQFLINDIYKNLEIAHTQLEGYLRWGGRDRRKSFEKSSEELLRLAFAFESFPRAEEVRRHSIDLKFQIISFIDAANAAISYQLDGILLKSNNRYQEAIRINNLIRDNFQMVFQVVIDNMERMKESTLINQRRIVQINITVLLLAILIYFLLMFEMLRSIIKPIRQLTDAAESVAAGDMDIDPIPVVSNDELKIMTVAFNTMIRVIRSQLEELSRKQELEAKLHREELEIERMNALVKETELKALQAKINPHFLFNTLNIVKQTAYLESAERTSTLVESFSAMLRYNLDYFDRNVRLEREVQTLQDYMAIQKTRFADRIDFRLSWDRAAATALIPALTLQPLVENAVMHGMKEVLSKGLIEVEIFRKEDTIEIRVRDNGRGMEYPILDAVRTMFSGGNQDLHEKEGIGLRNVFQRLQLSFEGRQDCSVSSIPGKGTEFRIIVPWIEGEL
jgi:two-component system, sensor histidine kinase YesM